MRIGITYDLKDEYLELGYSSEEVAEFDRLDTIVGIENALGGGGHRTTRIGRAASLIAHIASGERWDLVFNIAEGASGAARESQVPAILDAVGIPYTFSDPLVLATCLDKRLAKHVVRERGIPTPDFAVLNHAEEAHNVKLAYPLFVKPLAEGTSRGVTARSCVHNQSQLLSVCEELFAVYKQPVLVERYLPGREFTVGVIGTGARARSLGVLEVLLETDADQGVYSYDNKQLFEGRVRYAVATDDEALSAQQVALDAWNALGCRDGGRVDVRSDENGHPAFIEANPLAGLNPEISDLSILARFQGKAYPELILDIVSSASERISKLN